MLGRLASQESGTHTAGTRTAVRDGEPQIWNVKAFFLFLYRIRTVEIAPWIQAHCPTNLAAMTISTRTSQQYLLSDDEGKRSIEADAAWRVMGSDNRQKIYDVLFPAYLGVDCVLMDTPLDCLLRDMDRSPAACQAAADQWRAELASQLIDIVTP